MKSEEILKLAVYAGQIMLSNGAETERVEDTMSRILKAYSVKLCETFVTPTGIFVSVECEESGVETILKRIKIRSYHLGKVALVNNLSREIVSGSIGVSEALHRLDDIDKTPEYPSHLCVIAGGISCFAFCYLVGGGFAACFASLVTGMIMYSFMITLSKWNKSPVLKNIISGGLISLVALILVNFLPFLSTYFDKIIIGSIMPLVPGIGITNAIRDVLEGDYLSGSSRILDAVLIAVSIASGVGTVIQFWLNTFGGLVI